MREYDLYAQVVPSGGLKEVSYAQEFLLKKLEARELRTFCKKHNVPHTDVYRMATGERHPGYYIILALRFVIPPIMWFTEITEKKPRAKRMNKEEEEPSFENSKAFKMFLKGKIKDWVDKGFNFQMVYNMRKGKIKILTFKRILSLADKIPVEHWFIFED